MCIYVFFVYNIKFSGLFFVVNILMVYVDFFLKFGGLFEGRRLFDVI